MSNEIKINNIGSGLTDLFACIFNDAGQVCTVSTGAFGTFSLISLDNYDVSISEVATSSGEYRGDFPSTIAAGRYQIRVYRGVPATPSITHYIGSGEIVWDGTSEEFIIDTDGRVDVGYIEGTDATDQLEALSAFDTELDKTTDANHWRLKIKRKGTSTVIATKLLYDTTGTAISSTTQIIGRQTESS